MSNNNDNDEAPIMDEEQEFSDSKWSSGPYELGLHFDDAIEKTVFDERCQKKYPSEYTWGKRLCCGCPFQVVVLIAFIIICDGMHPILQGLGFLEKVPKHFTCKRINPDTNEEVWVGCTKEEICREGLTSDEY